MIQIDVRYKTYSSQQHITYNELPFFKGNISQLEQAERKGTVIKRKDRLVFAAQRYTACKPMNASNTQRGWYDDESERTAPGNTVTVSSFFPAARVSLD